MGIIKRKWTPEEAEEWTKEEFFACIFSSLSYIFLLTGVALSMFLKLIGFILLAAGIICMLIMIYIIDPKLKIISEEYEKNQKNYLKSLEEIQRWE